MLIKMLSSSVFLVVLATFAISSANGAKVVCYYDGLSYYRDGVARADNLTEAATLCDQLIYGYYKVNSDYGVETSFKFPYPKGANAGSELKIINPNLKVLFSVGGPVSNRKTDRSLKLIESPEKRTTFVNAVAKTIGENNYDGVDIAWQWPENFDEKDKQFMDSGIISFAKNIFGQVQEKLRETPAVYAEGFHALIRELKATLKPTGKILSISALPHVNSTAYFDLANLKELADQFVLHTYDYRSPQYFPKLADHSAPLHFKNATHRQPADNVEATVQKWLSAGVPSDKLIVAIPSFGRTWQIDNTVGELTKRKVEPPYKALDIAEVSTYTKIKGLVSYYEVCPHLSNYSPQKDMNASTPATTLYSRVPDADKRLGTFCFRLPGVEQGVWISYEEPETAAVKAAFIKNKKLAGAAVVDISLDDFNGMCAGGSFPILKAIKQNV